MEELQRALDDFIAAHDRMPGVVVHVEGPGLSWDGAAGVVERGGGPLPIDACVRIASITKTFVAASVLRLVGRGDVSLDAAALDLLPPDAAALLAASTSSAPSITVRHLLQHMSGVYDFGTDAEHFGAAIVADPHRRWTAMDQLRVAFDHGAPYCEPGVEFHYSDTGYVLLGWSSSR